jgi:hypothetical protein
MKKEKNIQCVSGNSVQIHVWSVREGMDEMGVNTKRGRRSKRKHYQLSVVSYQLTVIALLRLF